MSAPKGRAVAPARPLLYLSGADGLVFLLVEAAALLPLLPLDGPFPLAFAWTAVALVAAAGSGFLGGRFLNPRRPSRLRALGAGIANAVLILAVAVYFATALQIFGSLGPIMAALAVPSLAASVILWMTPVAA